MSKSAVIHARIEPEAKVAAERILNQLGLSPTEAIRLFYRQITLRQGLPFPVKIPNELTQKTLASSRLGKETETFDSLDEMFESWER